MNIFKNWWSLAFNGIIAILYGMLALFVPAETLSAIIIWFGIIVLIIGLSMLIGVIMNIRSGNSYVSELVLTILIIAFGALLAFYTDKSITIFTIVIGVWALLIGGVQLYQYFTYKTDESRSSVLISSITTLVFGAILLFNPFSSGTFLGSALVVASGLMGLFIGVMLIIIAFKMKNLSQELEED